MTEAPHALFDNLYRDYYQMVLHVCKGFTKGDTDTAKDLVQDVFINTWKALDKFKGESSYKTWIYRITVNTCLKFIRDRKGLQELSIDRDNFDTADKTQENEQSIGTLYKAIGMLADIDRLIIIMVLDELDYDEIATVMGLSNVNLRVKIHRIKQQLAKILTNE
jgi:RNA polymerase sigma factor (sigma-70 family)